MIASDPWRERLSEYLDGELESGERERLERHRAGCAECTLALEELRRVVAFAHALPDRPPSGDLWPAIARDIRSGSLAHRPGIAPPSAAIRRRPSRLVGLAVAASFALVVVLAFSGGPATSRIVERLAEITHLPIGQRAARAPELHPIPPPIVRHLVPAGDELVLEFERHQLEGALEVRVAQVDRATIQVTTGGQVETVLVTPEGFRVRNSARSATDYRVTVPARLVSVEIRVGDPQDVYVIHDLYLPLRWVFGLQEYPGP